MDTGEVIGQAIAVVLLLTVLALEIAVSSGFPVDAPAEHDYLRKAAPSGRGTTDPRRGSAMKNHDRMSRPGYLLLLLRSA